MSPLKALLWFLFVTSPAVLLSGFAVFKLNEALANNGVQINENLYWLILLLAMWAALTISSKKLIKEMHARNKSKETEVK